MRWPKRPIRADRRRGHCREETLRVAARSVLACIATLHPLTVPGTAQEAPTPIPGQLVVLGADGEPVAGAVVQGRLFDGVGAEPVAGCLVELLYPGPGAIAALMLRQRHLTVSDAEGRYLLGGLGAGRHHLRLQCPGAPVMDRLVVLGANGLADQGELFPACTGWTSSTVPADAGARR